MIDRTPPKCFKCGANIKATYRSSGPFSIHHTRIGEDLFSGWDYDGHHCNPIKRIQHQIKLLKARRILAKEHAINKQPAETAREYIEEIAKLHTGEMVLYNLETVKFLGIEEDSEDIYWKFHSPKTGFYQVSVNYNFTRLKGGMSDKAYTDLEDEYEENKKGARNKSGFKSAVSMMGSYRVNPKIKRNINNE